MKFFFLAICMAFTALFSTAQPFRINEVMSSNGGVITDMDGDTSDWIELFNSGTTAVNLNGFGLSDKKDQPFEWIFPDYKVSPGEYLLVFASGKDRRIAPVNWNTIISSGDDWKYLVPVAEPTDNWRISSFDDSSWKTGKSGFGMADNDDATIVTVNKSIFLRKKFNIDNAASVRQLILHMDYDDGFVAYLNGVEIARAQMVGRGDLPRFDIQASGQHEALMYQGIAPEKFVIANPALVLKTGENILSIQVHNVDLTSSDLSAIPFLSVETTEKALAPRIVSVLALGNQEFHTNFKLDADGESLYLTNPLGTMTDSVRIGALKINYSYGRSSKDAAQWVIYSTSTPGIINSGEELSGEMTGKPVFSYPGGVYPASMKVSISAPIKGDTIYYTTDGSVPTASSLKVVGEINIPTSKVLKARIIKAGMVPGEIVTNSYLIYGNSKMPVVSISMNPNDLWDYNTGIYVDGPNWTADNPHFGANYWQDWERACHFELMETTGNKVIDVDAGIKIFGNWSRANPQKSLAFYCKKAYGYDEMNYKIFNDRPYDKFKNVVLRNSGNDWNNSMFRDGLMSGLTYGLNFDQQAFRPATIFLNGEYWGIQNIREKINEHMIAQHHSDVDENNITMLENDGTVIVGSDTDYRTMMSFLASNSLANQTNYTKMLGWIDVNSFIDYFSSQIYCRNGDWPGNNIRFWKTNDLTGRWRWIMYDTDAIMNLWGGSVTDNSLAAATDPNGPGWPNPPWSTLILRKLLENTGFRNQFVNRFADLLNSNFLADRVNKAIDQKRDAITDEIAQHLLKWNGGSKTNWLNNVQQMKNFATARPSYVFGHIKGKFTFQNQQIITAQADSMQGLIQLNSLKLSNFPWKGSYFPDVPITLTALPKVGYKFVKWTGITTGSDLATVKVVPQGNMVLTAVFEKDGNHYQDIVINEISFNNAATADPGDWIELTNTGQYDIDISGWKVTDSDPNHQYIFAASTILKANEYVVVSSDLIKFNSVFTGVKNLYGPFNFGLSSTLDAVRLYSREEQLVDEVNYTNISPWPTSSFDELWSLELTNPTLDNNSGANWVLSIKNGTPGSRNTPYIVAAVDNLPAATNSSVLMQNYPNPFNEGTYIEFKLPQPGEYRISILDVNGRILRILKGEDQMATDQTIYWDGKDDSGRAVITGVYFYRLEAAGLREMKQMVKMK
ncbi:MAG TPA: hypothetical protein DCL77_13745 [Prolixibacteraceae bacterium]|jgi:hypothetical protein|nr:hypothetical protein [Prolixibacteraceae bacterium]